jgi:CubicO group peptidase (beta-lactamase class C family)
MTIDVAAIADEVFASTPELASVPGVAFGVVHDGALVHSGGYGTATVGGATPRRDTVFRIASMTKSFTAAAVMVLRDEGRLRLDDPASDHLPAARSLDHVGMPPITVRDLLTMGGGLATDDPWGDRQESLPLEQFDAMVADGFALCWPPRTTFEYSNTGYALLGRVIASVSGMPFTQFVLERLCEPLGMASTGFVASGVDPDRLATGYRVMADGTHVPEALVGPGAYSAMGGLLSTVDDLARWVGGLAAAWRDDASTHPVGRWSLREMQELARFVAIDTTAGTGAGTVAVGYGYGLQSMHHQVLGRIVAHSGGYPGFGSHMRWHPASGWGVVALGNSSYAPMHVPVAEALARIVVETESSHGSRPAVAVVPWPETVAAMGMAERLLDGDDSGIADATWSPNMDFDLPRTERADTLRDVRDAIGPFTRDDASVRHASPARAAWTVTGASGTANLELWMTPERRPRIQKLTVQRLAR